MARYPCVSGDILETSRQIEMICGSANVPQSVRDEASTLAHPIGPRGLTAGHVHANTMPLKLQSTTGHTKGATERAPPSA